MGQKVHPVAFRLGITKKHSTDWFAKIGKLNKYSDFVQEDRIIREFLFHKIPTLHKVSITRKNSALLIYLEASYPRDILPKLDVLKIELQKKLEELKIVSNSFSETENKVIDPIFFTISRAKEISAKGVALYVKDELEKRMPFRRAMKKSLRVATAQGIGGLKIEISGRLNGAEIARTEWERIGAVPLQSFRSNIDYTEERAQTIYGVIGIKVWVNETAKENV